ncbi:PH domain-containing protein [Pedobacter fastidiosus]|uniref:PH domain-containing protein n=1 Tax=Pedobacter fastidiosus TaxID=2765361 RepID=A0ABR7KTW1_9SPHI|nr:PH domain-containing protein [Pedobacter fastidiosus]MBC6111497.1 PH domain-containing protein [Pedobacter fastidiosus]
MQSFTNEIVDLDSLPKFEDIQLQKPHADYWKIICINLLIFFGIIGIGAIILICFVEEIRAQAFLIIGVYLALTLILFLLFRASFKKRGYAVRAHDVIYKSGIIAETTTIVPLNRIQHIELNEGIFSRIYNLGSLQIFTAGGQTGHLHIAGIPIDVAQGIRDLLLKKLDIIENQTAEIEGHE